MRDHINAFSKGEATNRQSMSNIFSRKTIVSSLENFLLAEAANFQVMHKEERRKKQITDFLTQSIKRWSLSMGFELQQEFELPPDLREKFNIGIKGRIDFLITGKQLLKPILVELDSGNKRWSLNKLKLFSHGGKYQLIWIRYFVQGSPSEINLSRISIPGSIDLIRLPFNHKKLGE